MIAEGFAESQPFKDVLIGPIDGKNFSIDKPLLKPLIDDCRVHLSGWGGPDFPIQKYHDTKEKYLQTGLRCVDPKLVLYGPETFHLWQLDSNLNFIQRSPMAEDFIRVGPSDPQLSGTLVRSWTLADIVSPLIFAKNVLNKTPELERIGVKYIWEGLNERKLILLPGNRFVFGSYFQCQVHEWIYETEVRPDTDITEAGLSGATELFWLFGFVPGPGELVSDIQNLASGRFSA